MNLVPAYTEIVDFLAAGTNPDSLIAFEASDAAKQRVAELIQYNKTTGPTEEEHAELDHFMQLGHLMRLAKARARHYQVVPG